MEQKFWAMASILVLIKTQLEFLLGWIKQNRILETQWFNSTPIKLSTKSHPPVGMSEYSFSSDNTRNPHFSAIGGDKAPH